MSVLKTTLNQHGDPLFPVAKCHTAGQQFTKGITEIEDGADFPRACINVNTYSDMWWNRIEVHGYDISDAKALRDRVLMCLTTHDELVEALRELLAAYSAVYPPFEEGGAAQDAWASRRVCASNAAYAVLAKVEAR